MMIWFKIKQCDYNLQAFIGLTFPLRIRDKRVLGSLRGGIEKRRKGRRGGWRVEEVEERGREEEEERGRGRGEEEASSESSGSLTCLRNLALLRFSALLHCVHFITFQHHLRWPLLMICLFLSNCLPAPWLLAHYTVYNIHHQMLDRFTTFPFFANASSFHISWTAISSEHISPLLVGHLSNI